LGHRLHVVGEDLKRVKLVSEKNPDPFFEGSGFFILISMQDSRLPKINFLPLASKEGVKELFPQLFVMRK
jgi:hypothetical protein